ncbi:transcription factor WhiB [Aeromicrobium sp. CF4.19]|uniref:WhiB family transcriptional regulator n=1 Tax=Aeromicrobium sp. CF4.19 TaxID=3373082 RepID=UPI003EE556C6
MTIAIETPVPPCAHQPELFEDVAAVASTTSGSGTVAAVQERLAVAHRSCAGCPMLVDCLYRAVVEVDVSGFVACTTEADRATIRRQLGIEVTQPTLAPYGTTRLGNGPVSHEMVVAVRHAHPKDTCQQLAERLGCSTSTIKRHLRRAREEATRVEQVSTLPQRRTPSIEEVLDAFDALETSQFA